MANLLAKCSLHSCLKKDSCMRYSEDKFKFGNYVAYPATECAANNYSLYVEDTTKTGLGKLICPECKNQVSMLLYRDDEEACLNCTMVKHYTKKQETKEEKGMTFKELLPTFIAGTPIKRKTWGGYWIYKFGTINIHTKDGEVINLLDTEDILFTIAGILEDDWEIATNENCVIEVRG